MTKSEAVAVVDDAAIVAIIGLAVLLVGGTVISENQENFAEACKGIYQVMDYADKMTVFAIASTRNYVTNTVNATKEQISTLVNSITALFLAQTVPTLIQPLNFAVPNSVPFYENTPYDYAVAYGDVPVSIYFNFDREALKNSGNYIDGDYFVPVTYVIGNSPPFVHQQYFYAEGIEPLIEYGVNELGKAYLTVSSLVWNDYLNKHIRVKQMDLLFYLSEIASSIGVTLPDVSISSDVVLKQYDTVKSRDISLLLNPEAELVELPVIDRTLDKIFEDVIVGDTLPITVPRDLPVAIPTLRDFVPSSVAKEFDVNPPFPILPDMDWLKFILEKLLDVLRKILALLASILSILSNILEKIKFEVQSFNLDLKPLKIPLHNKFPYCLPWDFLKGLKLFYATPTPPDLTIKIDTRYLKLSA